MTNIFDKIVKISLSLLVFLTPLFWLPFSFEAYEFNKQYLIFFLVSLAVLAWLAKMILVNKEIRFRRTPLDGPILLFLSVAILSAIFSVDKNSSIFGFYGRFSDGLIGLLGLGAFYFLLTNNVKGERGEKGEKGEKGFSIHSLIKVFLWSVFFVVLISYFSIFGIWQKIFPQAPSVLLQKTFSPVSGSLEGLAVFLSIFIVFLVGRCLCLTPGVKQSVKHGVGNCLLLLAALGLLILIDFQPAWIILLVSFFLLLLFALSTRLFKENVNRLLLPIFLIMISAAFIFVDASSLRGFILKGQLPKEQVLSQKISWQVGFAAGTDNIKNALAGSGIGTWHYDFAKYKSAEFNKNLWWQVRYDRAGNYLAETLGTMGFLGIINYLLLIIIFFLLFWLLPQKFDFLPFALTILALFVSQLVYEQNTVLAFAFWFILGLSAVSRSEKTFSFKDFPELNLIFSSVLIVIGLAILGIYFLAGKYYFADVNYRRALIASSIEERAGNLERAVNLNTKSATYRIILARALSFQISQDLTKPTAEQNLTKIQNLTAKAIDQAKLATEFSPNNVAAWETLGMIYRDIQFIAGGSTEWAVKAFQKAIELEPKNPVFYTELGKLYLGSDIAKARESFAKAKEMKSDYIDALIQDGLTYEREKNFDEALKKMEELVSAYPFNIEAKFQLGRLYYNKDKLDESILQFEQIILLMPNHSNSLYSLGMAYTKKGEKKKAISVFENVLELNPGNPDVLKKLEELRK